MPGGSFVNGQVPTLAEINAFLTSVATADIANLAVTTAKIDDLAVTAAKLAADAVTQAKIADNAVGTAEIIDANVTAAKLAALAVTAPKLATQPYARARKSANQSIASGSYIALTLDTLPLSSDVTLVSNALTINTAGLYLIFAIVQFSGTSTTGIRGMDILKNGAAIQAGIHMNAASTGDTILFDMCINSASVADTVTMRGYQTSGGSLDVVGGSVNTSLHVLRLWPA